MWWKKESKWIRAVCMPDVLNSHSEIYYEENAKLWSRTKSNALVHSSILYFFLSFFILSVPVRAGKKTCKKHRGLIFIFLNLDLFFCPWIDTFTICLWGCFVQCTCQIQSLQNICLSPLFLFPYPFQSYFIYRCGFLCCKGLHKLNLHEKKQKNRTKVLQNSATGFENIHLLENILSERVISAKQSLWAK